MTVVPRGRGKKVTLVLQSFILLYARPKAATAGIRGRNFKGARGFAAVR